MSGTARAPHSSMPGRRENNGWEEILTPRASIWIVDCWVYITKVDLAHETIDLYRI